MWVGNVIKQLVLLKFTVKCPINFRASVRKAHFTVNFSNASCFITFPTYILYHKMRGPSQLSHYNEDFCKQHYINTNMLRRSRSYAYCSLWPKMISHEPSSKIHAAAPRQKCSYLEITNKIRKFLLFDWPKVFCVPW